MDHPLIKRFEGAAEVLDIQEDRRGLDDAIVQLATWMDLAADHLTADDVIVLTGIGALLYRDGLLRRMA